MLATAREEEMSRVPGWILAPRLSIVGRLRGIVRIGMCGRPVCWYLVMARYIGDGS